MQIVIHQEVVICFIPEIKGACSDPQPRSLATFFQTYGDFFYQKLSRI